MHSSSWSGALAALLLLLAPAPALPAVPAAAPPARNLLLNPGFERGLAGHEWMAAGWDTSDAGLTTVFFGRDSLLPHGGTFSVNVANTSTIWPMSHNWSQTILVGREAWNRDAVLSVWTRSAGQEGRGYILVQAYADTVTRMARIWGVPRDEARQRMMINAVDDPLRNLGWARTQFTDAATPWVRREARMFVPAGTNVLFVRCGLIGTGQVAFDDASLTLAPPTPAPRFAAGVNLLRDPSFEQGALDWEWSVPPFQGARIDADSTVARTGRVSMRLSQMNDGAAPSRMGMVQALRCQGLRGKRLRVSGWFKGDSLVKSAFVKVYFDTPHGLVQSPGTVLHSGTFDWRQTVAEVDVPADADEMWAWLCIEAPSQGIVWMDDAALEIVPLPAPAPAGAPAVKHR